MSKKASRSAYRFNIIDILLILIILLAAGLAAYLVIPHGSGAEDAKKSTPITYQITVNSLAQRFKGNVKEGDLVYLDDSDTAIGEVQNVTYSPSVYIGTNRENGTLTYLDYPGELTMTVTIRATADMTEDIYDIDGFILEIGMVIDFRVPNLLASGRCTEITEITEP